MNKEIEKIETIIRDIIIPKLQLHNGSMVLTEFKDGIVYGKLLGNCSNCPANQLGTRDWILETLVNNTDFVKDVVIESTVSNDLLNQAREILRRGK